MNKKDKSQIKSEFLRDHWDIASDMYHLAENSLKYYDLENPTSFSKSHKGQTFNNDLFDLTLVIEAFKNAWNSLYKTFVLESMRDNVLDFFYKLQTGTLEEQVSAPYTISVIDIDYDLLNGFDLLATQSYLLYPWENYKDFQPQIKCDNQITDTRKSILNRICEEIYEELNIDTFDDLQETLEDGYYDFDYLLTENKRQDYEYYIEFMRNCWNYTKGKTGSNVLGFMFVHDKLHYTSLDDYTFSKGISTKEKFAEFKDYLKSKGINF